MLKRFFISLLGTIAGIWISFGLLFFVGVIFAVVIGTQPNEKVSIDKHSVLYLNLSGLITERQQAPSIFEELAGNENPTIALNEIVASVRAAADDKNIEGIFIEANGTLGGFASRTEIIQALRYFKDNSDKWVIAYGDSYTQGDYYVSSLADEIFINPMGGVDIHGIALTTYFYKNLLDKLGVKMQIIKVGTYKSAVEPYMLTDISEANREQQKLFTSQIWDDVASTIADNRATKPANVNLWADSLIMTEAPQTYVDRNIVTGVVYRHEVISMLKEKTGVDKDDDLKLVSPATYCSATELPHTASSNNNIAVLYAVGEIFDSGKDGIVGPEIIKQIEKIIEDDDNSGLILRVNSPGGSAFASEQIWEALQRYKKTGRPFYVSMSDYAASGGYYISCGADKIYAQPTTLTGSIGIFGMIPCVQDLMTDKLGINKATVQTNPNADFISLTTEMTPQQLHFMQNEINRGYETFTSRCADGRKMPLDSLKAIAEGRVWDGETALTLGLVDKLGNLNDAISDMASELGFTKKYTVNEYPRLKLSFWDRLEDLNIGTIRAGFMKNELGESYELYRKLEEIKRMEKVQARMEDMVLN